MTFARRALLVGTVLAGMLALAGAAEPVADADARAIRRLVEAQLHAMATGDARLAFSYASPDIHRQFGTAENFMAMVRQGYPMVVAPASTSFYLPEPDDQPAMVLQMVQLTDRTGRRWLASYQLQRQPDGGWRINGCAVVADRGAART